MAGISGAFSLGFSIKGRATAFGICPQINSNSVQNLGGGLVLDLVNNKLYAYTVEALNEYAAPGASEVVAPLSIGSYTVSGAASAQTSKGFTVLGSNGSALIVSPNKTGWQTQFSPTPAPFLSSNAQKYGLGAYSALLYNQSYEMPPGIPGVLYIGQSGTVQNPNTGFGGYGTIAYSQAGQLLGEVSTVSGSLHLCKGGQSFYFGSTSTGYLQSLTGEKIALPAGFDSCYYFGEWPQGDVFVLETSDNLVTPVLYTGSNVLSPLEISGGPVFTALEDFGTSADSETAGTTLGKYGAILALTNQTPGGWLIDLEPGPSLPLTPFPAVRKAFCFCSEDYRAAVEATY